MANLSDEKNIPGVFGGVEFGNSNDKNQNNNQNTNNIEFMQNAGTIRNQDLPVKRGFWSKFKTFWLQEVDWNREIKIKLTPYQQKVEDEINEFLHQEITWEKVHDFLFQEIKFGKRKNK